MEHKEQDTIGVQRRRNFTIISNAVLSDQRLSQKAVMVYLAIAKHADGASGTAWPSFATIAQYARMSRRSAIEGLKELETVGYVKKKAAMKYSVNGKASQASNTYTIFDEVTDSDAHAFKKKATQEQPERGVVQEVHQGSAGDAPGVVHQLHTNQTPSEEDSKKGGGETPHPPKDSKTEEPAKNEEVTREGIADIAATYGFSKLAADFKAIAATQKLAAEHGADIVEAALHIFYEEESKKGSRAELHWFVGQFDEKKRKAQERAQWVADNTPREVAETEFQRALRERDEEGQVPPEEAQRWFDEMKKKVGVAV